MNLILLFTLLIVLIQWGIPLFIMHYYKVLSDRKEKYILTIGLFHLFILVVAGVMEFLSIESIDYFVYSMIVLFLLSNIVSAISYFKLRGINTARKNDILITHSSSTLVLIVLFINQILYKSFLTDGKLNLFTNESSIPTTMSICILSAILVLISFYVALIYYLVTISNRIHYKMAKINQMISDKRYLWLVIFSLAVSLLYLSLIDISHLNTDNKEIFNRHLGFYYFLTSALLIPNIFKELNQRKKYIGTTPKKRKKKGD